MSTIGYGDITAGTTLERVFSCVMMVLGSCVYAYGITSVISSMSGVTEQQRRLLSKRSAQSLYVDDGCAQGAQAEASRVFCALPERVRCFQRGLCAVDVIARSPQPSLQPCKRPSVAQGELLQGDRRGMRDRNGSAACGESFRSRRGHHQ